MDTFTHLRSMEAPTIPLTTRTTLLAFSIGMLMMGGCAHVDPDDPDSSAAMLANPAMSGARQAHRDLKAKQIQLMEAGVVGVDPPEVAPNDPRFRNIPRKHLPSGPDEPHAAAWAKYARAYNAVVIKDFERETGQ